MEFPTASQVFDRVYDEWGGGIYEVKANVNRTRILASYDFEGASRAPGSNNSTPATPTLRKQIESGMATDFIEALDPVTRMEIGKAVVLKSLGVSLSKTKAPTLHEQMIAKAMEEDPDVVVN